MSYEVTSSETRRFSFKADLASSYEELPLGSLVKVQPRPSEYDVSLPPIIYGVVANVRMLQGSISALLSGRVIDRMDSGHFDTDLSFLIDDSYEVDVWTVGYEIVNRIYQDLPAYIPIRLDRVEKCDDDNAKRFLAAGTRYIRLVVDQYRASKKDAETVAAHIKMMANLYSPPEREFVLDKLVKAVNIWLFNDPDALLDIHSRLNSGQDE